jgi:hypothetical protein
MDRDHEIKARAEEARREAEKTSSDWEHERWLRIMQGWLYSAGGHDTIKTLSGID